MREIYWGKLRKYRNYEKFYEWFKKQRKGKLPSIYKMRNQLGNSNETIKNYLEVLEKEGKIELCVKKGRLKEIRKI